MNNADMKEMLTNAQVIAVVGHSDQPFRTSYQIGHYLRNAGYTVIPVNPMVAEIDGEKSYASLADVPVPIDIVDVFRRSEHLEGVVEETIAVGAKNVWAQLGVSDSAAAAKAEAAGLGYVEDLCIKVEHARLGVPYK